MISLNLSYPKLYSDYIELIVFFYFLNNKNDLIDLSIFFFYLLEYLQSILVENFQ